MSQNDPLEQDPERKRKFWKAHIQQWKHSGLNQADYCKANGLVPHRFTYWKKRLNQPPDTGASFVPLQIADNLPVPVKKARLTCLPLMAIGLKSVPDLMRAASDN